MKIIENDDLNDNLLSEIVLQHFSDTGKWPTKDSGIIASTGEDWKNIDDWLRENCEAGGLQECLNSGGIFYYQT
jgi:hypothetical protein